MYSLNDWSFPSSGNFSSPPSDDIGETIGEYKKQVV